MDKQKEIVSGADKALTTRQSEQVPTISVLNLFNEKELAQAEVFLKKIIATEKGGIKSVNEGLAILMRAQDLQLPFSTCIEHIHIIQGKVGVDVHVIKALLLRAGVTWRCTKPYTPLYQYTDGNTIYNEDKLPQYCVICRSSKEAEEKTNADQVGVYPLKWYSDLKGNLYNEFQISSKCVVALNPLHAKKLQSEGQFPVIRVPAVPIDYVVEYEFTRYFLIGGKERVMTCKSSFSINDAKAAGLLDKDNYKKYPKTMTSHRAFTLGARDIADDKLMGVMEINELAAITGVAVPLDSDYVDDYVIE